MAGAQTVTKASGEPTGEILFTTEPRSFVICGSLGEFRPSMESTSGSSVRSTLSPNLLRPEISRSTNIRRARFIVEAERKDDGGAAA